MSIDFEKKYRIDDHFSVEERDGKYLYTDLENGNWFRTNESGHTILSLFDGNLTLREVIDRYAAQEGFPNTFMEKKMISLIETAIKRRLLLHDRDVHKDLSTEFRSYPNELWIHVTDICNMQCPFCYSSSGTDGVRFLESGKILRFVSGIPHDERRSIIISGGEPLLYSDLPNLLRELKALNYEITVISNGTCDKEKYDKILPYLDALQISIDGPTESVYSRTRGAGNYDKAVSILDYVHGKGLKNLIVSFTTNIFNISTMQDMPEFALNHHVNHIHITRILPSGRANDIMNKIVPTAKDYGEAIGRLGQAVVAINKRIEMIRETEEAFLEDEEKTRFITFTTSSDPIRRTLSQTKVTTCSMGCGTLSIGYDGMIYPCGCLQQQSLKMGTIEDSIDTVMKIGHQMSIKYGIDNPAMEECYACAYKYICGGGCRACAYSAGNMMGKDPMCDFYKERIQKAMWDVPAQNT